MMWTVRYSARSGQRFEVVVDAKTKHDAFAIAQRHGVTPFQVVPGGVMPQSGESRPQPYFSGTVTVRERKPWYSKFMFWRGSSADRL